MSDVQVRIEHFPEEAAFKYCAEVYVDGDETGMRGYHVTKLGAIEQAREKYEASLGKQDTEWLSLYVDPVASRKA